MIIGFISAGCLLLGAGGILLLLSRKSRSLSDEDIARLVRSAPWYQRLEGWWVEHVRQNLESGTLEQRLSVWFEKALRSLHVVLLRADNRLHALIQRTREGRERRAVDQEYWANIQNATLEKKIEKLFGDMRKNYRRDAFDPVEEERALVEGRISDPERWFNLIRFYLAKEHNAEARRIVARYWMQNKQDENAFVLLEGVLRSAGIAEKTSPEPGKDL